MRKLYNDFFHVPKDGKISEKVMLSRMTLTAIMIIACLFAMGISAYAYFGHSVASSSNVIYSANFETKLTIENSVTKQSVDISDADKATKSATLEAGTYSVTIEKLGNASTGFCVISAENGGDIHYYTQQLGKDVKAPNEETLSITFKITVTETTTVSFTSTWGTSPYYADYAENDINDVHYIIDKEEVDLQFNNQNP